MNGLPKFIDDRSHRGIVVEQSFECHPFLGCAVSC
jgi:hypothetical protein